MKTVEVKKKINVITFGIIVNIFMLLSILIELFNS
jgi:hypothetical protein